MHLKLRKTPPGYGAREVQGLFSCFENLASVGAFSRCHEGAKVSLLRRLFGGLLMNET